MDKSYTENLIPSHDKTSQLTGRRKELPQADTNSCEIPHSLLVLLDEIVNMFPVEL